MAEPVKDGKDTTEFKAAQSASVWGIVAMVLGFITTGLAPILSKFFDADSTAGVVAGACIAVAGIVLKTLTSLGYIKSRTDVKVSSQAGE